MPIDNTESSDAELIARVHEGEASGFAELYARHRKAAKAYARRLTPAVDADDLVAEGFTQVFVQLQRGAGPRTVLRPYLFTTIRNLHLRRSRRDRRLVVTGDEAMLDTPVEFEDVPEAEFDRAAAVRAFRSLPDRWQGVLWSLDVERRAASDIAPSLGLSPNAVSALAVRAREGLRQAYLREHLAVVTDPDCRAVLGDLPAYVRGSASRRRRNRIDEHLPGCARCQLALRDLEDLNSRLAVLLLPVLVVSGYAASLHPLGLPHVAGEALRRALDALRSTSNRLRAATVSGIAAVAAAGLLIPPGTAPSDLSALDPPRPTTTRPTTKPSHAEPTRPEPTRPAARPTAPVRTAEHRPTRLSERPVRTTSEPPGTSRPSDRPSVRSTDLPGRRVGPPSQRIDRRGRITDLPGRRIGPRDLWGKVAGRRDEPPSVSGGRQERRHGGMTTRSRHTGIRDRRGPVSRPSLVQETAAPGRDAKSRGKIG